MLEPERVLPASMCLQDPLRLIGLLGVYFPRRSCVVCRTNPMNGSKSRFITLQAMTHHFNQILECLLLFNRPTISTCNKELEMRLWWQRVDNVVSNSISFNGPSPYSYSYRRDLRILAYNILCWTNHWSTVISEMSAALKKCQRRQFPNLNSQTNQCTSYKETHIISE